VVTIEHRQWTILLAIVCLLVGWNYWLNLFFFSTPFALFGVGFGDFEIFRLAAKSWLSHANPYIGSRGFIYPPTSLPFFALFAPLPFVLANQLWWITYFACFVLSSIALCLTLRSTDRRFLYFSILALLFLTSYPLLVLFQLGQVDLLVEGFAIMSLAFQRLRHGYASAVMLSLATLMKGPAVILLVYFVLFRRDFKYLFRFLLSTTVAVGISLFVIPVGVYEYYFLHVVPTFSGVINASSNQSVGGLVSIANLSPIAPMLSLVGFVLFVLFSWWAGSRRLPLLVENLSSDAMFLMNVLIMLLFGPRSIIYPYVWVIIPLALFLSGILMEPVRIRYFALVGFAAFLLNSNWVFLRARVIQVLPFEVIGNIMITLCLVLFYVRPAAIIQDGKTKTK